MKENIALPRGWVFMSLTDFCANQPNAIKRGPFGSALRKENFVPTGYKVYEQQHAIKNDFTAGSYYIDEFKFDELRAFEVHPNDLIISCSGTIGRVAIMPERAEPGIINQALLKLTLNNEIVFNRYFIHLFQFLASQIMSSRGTGMQNLAGVKELKTVRFPISPINEQHRIVSEIETQFTRLDASLAALERVQANLKRYRASVLQAACEGRLVPTEAELAREEGHSYEPADQLRQRILQERRAKWEAEQLANMKAKGKSPKDDKWKSKYKEPVEPDTSELPELPEGWVWSSIGKTCEVFVGATPSRREPEYWNGNISWVSSGEVAFCRIRTTRETITELGLRNSSTEVHPPGTILLGMIGEGKTRGQVAILDISACNNQNSAAIRVSEAGLPPEFIYYFLESQYERTRQLGSGNNQPALNKTRVQEMVVLLPPLAEQHRIIAEIQRHTSIIESAQKIVEANLLRCEKLRQSILKRTFEGRLVSQDPTDEPASALLERIRAEREQAMEKPKTARKTKPRKHKTQPKVVASVPGELVLEFGELQS